MTNDPRTTKKRIATAGASLALVAAIVGVGLTSAPASVSAAATSPAIAQLRQAEPSPVPVRPGRPGEGRPGPDMQQRQQQQQAYMDALAGRLGVSADQLAAAMKQARIDLINKAVADGKLDQERADRMIQNIQNGQPGQKPGMGQRQQGPGRRGPGGPGGPGAMQPGAGKAVADILGVTPEELRTEFQAGKSLAQIAEAKGISRDTLKEKLLDARKTRLDAAVSAGRLTADQAQKMLERMTANIDRMLDMTPHQRRQPRAPGGGA